jgi:hypothetical protein
MYAERNEGKQDWEEGERRGKDFSNPSSEPVRVGSAFVLTAQFHSRVVSLPWQAHAQMPGYSWDLATNGNGEGELFTNNIFLSSSLFPPSSRPTVSIIFCCLLFSWLSLSLFRKVQFVLTLRGSMFPSSNQFGCVYMPVTVWLTGWFVTGKEMGMNLI